MVSEKMENDLDEATEKTADPDLNEKDLIVPDEMTEEKPAGAAVPVKKPAEAKKKAASLGKASAKKKLAKKKKTSAKKLAAKAEKVSGSEETVSMPDDLMIITDVPAAAAMPRKAGRPKGSRNIVTVNATDIPAKRGRKMKTGSAAMPVDTEVVSTTPAKRGRKPKTTPVNVPVDAVVIAKIPAKRGRKPKATVADVPADEAEMVKMPAKRGRKPKIANPAFPVDEAAAVRIPAKRGRKPKIAPPAFPVDAITPISAPVFGVPEGISAGNIEALLQRMTACMEILSKTMEILVRDLKKES